MRFRRVGVVGGGTMGAGIAGVLATAGATVELVEPDDGQAGRALARIKRHDRESAGRVRRLRVVAELADALDAVVEAVPEDRALKARVLRQVEGLAPRLLATNTSSIPIGDLAAGLEQPSGLVGLHFFNPVWVMPLIEVVRGERTDPAVVDRALTLVEDLGKEAVLVRDRPGFATSRLGVLLGLEAMRMLEDGVASAEDIDRAMVLGYRHPMGPLRLTDLVGLDTRLQIARVLQAAYGDRFAPPQVLVDKVARGELGRKTGQGFFSWPDLRSR